MNNGFYNSEPNNPFTSYADLRERLTRVNRHGDVFLDYLLSGDYFSGKAVG